LDGKLVAARDVVGEDIRIATPPGLAADEVTVEAEYR
jgi:hypothetical protein